MVPSSRATSTSTVGLPRESRISRAPTASMVAMAQCSYVDVTNGRTQAIELPPWRRTAVSPQPLDHPDGGRAGPAGQRRIVERLRPQRLRAVGRGDAEARLQPGPLPGLAPVAGVDPGVAEAAQVLQQPPVVAAQRQGGLLDRAARDVGQPGPGLDQLGRAVVLA